MHPIRVLLVLCSCLLVIALAVGSEPVQRLVESHQQCLIPLSSRVVGMDPYDPADFARYALEKMAQGDIIGQSYVCWERFLQMTKPPSQLPGRTRLLSLLYKYLPTSALRSSVRSEFLQAWTTDQGAFFTQLAAGSLAAVDSTSELVAFDLGAGRVFHVHLIAENGLRYVTSLELAEPSSEPATQLDPHTARD
jgi:hypothetical protein